MNRRSNYSSWLVLILAGAGMLAGCAREVYAPPVRTFPLESKWTIPAGQTAVQVESSLNTALLGPGIVGSDVRVRRGLNDRLEISGEGALIHVANAPRAHSNIYAARVGTKLDMENAGMSFTGGLGGGYAPSGGGFASIDAGLVSSYDNCVLIPFGVGRIFASVPFGAKQVDISKRGTAPGTRTDTAENTFGITLGGGLEIPLDQQCQPKAALLMGVGVTMLGDGNSAEIFTNAGMAIQVLL